MISGSHNKRDKYSLFNPSCEVTLHSISGWPFIFEALHSLIFYSFQDCYTQNFTISHLYLCGAAQEVMMFLRPSVQNFVWKTLQQHSKASV